MSNKKYNILFLQTKKWEEKYLQDQLAEVSAVARVDFFSGKLEEAPLDKLRGYEIISPFINSEFKSDHFKKLDNLKMIATRSTGFDHIDLSAAAEHKVAVANVPVYGSETVAEHTFALILSLARKIPQSVERTQKSDFDLTGLQGFDLNHKTIGVIGTGNIGQNVVQIAHGFDMNILAFDPYPKDVLIKKYNVKYVDLPELFHQSDIITLHVPYNKKTHHLINKKSIKQIKKGAYIINTARGGLIDTDALLAGLVSGHIAGAGLDVLEGENFIQDEVELLDKEISKENLETLLHDHILIKMDNVIVTPHNAFNSKEAIIRILDTTVDNIISFIEGKSQNLVKVK